MIGDDLVPGTAWAFNFQANFLSPHIKQTTSCGSSKHCELVRKLDNYLEEPGMS